MTYVSNWLPTNRTKRNVTVMVMRECFESDFNVKQIAGYFGVDIHTVYRSISVKDLKIKKARRIANQNVFS